MKQTNKEPHELYGPEEAGNTNISDIKLSNALKFSFKLTIIFGTSSVDLGQVKRGC